MIRLSLLPALLFSLLFLSQCQGQTTWDSTFLQKHISFSEVYPFIRYDLNQWEWDTITAVQSFFLALRNADKRVVKILHIGDSHIQADIYSGHVRQRLQQIFGNGGRGFIFPFSCGKTHPPYDYSTSHQGTWACTKNIDDPPILPLGITGITVRTTDSTASFQIQFLSQYVDVSNNRIMKVYAKQDSHAYSLQIQSDTCNPLPLHFNQNNLLPYQEIMLPCDPWKLRFSIQKTDSLQSFFELYGISLENTTLRGILYHSVGINGCGLKDILKEELGFRQIKELSPDLIIIDLGGNDYYPGNSLPSDFETTLRQLVEKIKSTAPRASILLVTNQSVLYRGKEVGAVQSAREVIRKVALDSDCALYDWYAVSGGKNSMWQWYLNHLAKKDHVHLTFKGYQLKGELFANALLASYHRFWMKKNLDSLPLPPGWHYDSTFSQPQPLIHIIKKGEVLGKIAQKYHVSVKDLMEWNRLQSTTIYPGQKLFIYKPGTQRTGQHIPSFPKQAPSFYTVKPGDTLWSISQRYQIPLAKLKEWNQIDDSSLIYPGQKLKLHP